MACKDAKWWWWYREKDLTPTSVGRIGRRISRLQVVVVSGARSHSYRWWSYRERNLTSIGGGRIGRRISLLQV